MLLTNRLGYIGGSSAGHSGAAVEPLCLPRDPEWGNYSDGTDGYKAYVYGTEYETHTAPGSLSTLQNHDAPCAVCLVRNRSIVRMFSGMNTLVACLIFLASLLTNIQMLFFTFPITPKSI